MRIVFSVIVFTCLLATNTAGAKDVVKELDSIVRHWQGLAKFNGSVIVAQHGKTILSRGYGLREVEKGNIDVDNTLYVTGGCTEMFTAAVIFKLQEEKKLSIEDTVARYVPDAPYAQQLQIKHLLAHQSGLFDYLSNDTLFDKGLYGPKSVQDIYDLFKNRPLMYQPGKDFNYSASDYFLLGKVIEHASGMSYYDAVRKYIFEPLKIKNSGFNFAGFASFDKAQGYSILNVSRYVPTFPPDSTLLYSAASLFTSAAGMQSWADALLGKKILSAESWQQMTTPHNESKDYGYGWQVADLAGKASVGHTGETYGFVNVLSIIPEDSTVIIVMSNDFESEIYRIRDDLAAALYGQPYSLPPARSPVFLEQRRLEQYVGNYEFENGMNLNVLAHDKLLWGKISGSDEFTMQADKEPNVFFLTSADVEFYFIREKGTNLVTDVIIRQNRKEIKGHKWQ